MIEVEEPLPRDWPCTMVGRELNSETDQGEIFHEKLTARLNMMIGGELSSEINTRDFPRENDRWPWEIFHKR